MSEFVKLRFPYRPSHGQYRDLKEGCRAEGFHVGIFPQYLLAFKASRREAACRIIHEVFGERSQDDRTNA